MKKLLVPFALIITIFLVSCSQTVDTNSISKQLDEIANNKTVAYSSRTDEYINAKRDIYDNIVKRGNAVLLYLVSELEKAKAAGHSGLRECIIGAICADITGIGKDGKGISTGTDWLALYYA